MHQEKYSLMWHTYSDHLRSMMKEMMMDEDFSDVTLVTEDKKQIKANINILSACSPVFKHILKIDKNSRPIIYLRGIQYTELESIMQFMYLGEASFYEERMDEFLAVAKSLEIKQLSETESNDDSDDHHPTSDQDTSTEFVEEQTVISDNINNQAQQQRYGSVVRGNGIYECDRCNKTYSDSGGLKRHIQSVHEGVKYTCDQCDYQAAQKCYLRRHIQSKHEGVKYGCDQCDYQSTTPNSGQTDCRPRSIWATSSP